MRTSWVPPAAAVFFFTAGLIFLQVSDAEKDLVFCLPTYVALAIGALIAATPQSELKADLVCICATVIFAGYIVLRTLTSPAVYAARPDLYFTLAALALYGVTAIILRSSAARIALPVSLLLFAVVHVLVSVIQAGWGENLLVVSSLEDVERSGRSTGLYVNPDHLAGLLEVLGIFGLSIACWSRWPAWSRVCIGYLAAICYFGLALTGSRGGYLSVVASLVLFAILSLITLSYSGAKLLIRVGGAGFVIIAVTLFAIGFLMIQRSASLKERLATMVTIDEGRIDLWHAAIEQWKLRPIIGTGSGTYRFYGREFRSERMRGDPVDVHNDYLHLLCEYGLIGAAGFVLFFAAHLRRGWRSFIHLGPKRLAAGFAPLSDRLALAIGALCAISAVAVHSAVDFNMHIPANALLLAFAFGLLANPGIEDKSKLPRSTPALLFPRFSIVVLSLMLLVQCLRLLPGEYYAEKTRAALRDENPAAAVALARKALTFERKNPNIFFYQARALVALGNEKNRSPDERSSLFDQALTSFDQARRLVPLDGTYPVSMAYVYDKMGRFAEAETMYQIARERDPRADSIAQLYQSHLESWETAKQKNP